MARRPTPGAVARRRVRPVATAGPQRAPAILTTAECARAVRVIVRRDPRFKTVVRQAGPCGLPESRTHHPFVAMVRALVSQQLSGKAAATIYGRVVALAGGVDRMVPDRLLALDPADLRTAGLSRQKISYLVDLSEHVKDGRLNLEALEDHPDELVIDAITAVKGFGRWSAEMFLMFRLNRPDVFPVTDLGIVKGMQRMLEMKRKPSVRTMLRAAELWRPYRSVAAWYLWRIVDAPTASPQKPIRKSPRLAQRLPAR